MNQFFAETLKRIRSEQGLSQQQLADKIIVNRSTVAKWESGSRLPDDAMIYRLAGIFGVDTDVLSRYRGKRPEQRTSQADKWRPSSLAICGKVLYNSWQRRSVLPGRFGFCSIF